MLGFLDRERFAVNEGVGHLPSSALEQSLNGSPRNVHCQGCLLLMQSLEIAERQRLELI